MSYRSTLLLLTSAACLGLAPNPARGSVVELNSTHLVTASMPGRSLLVAQGAASTPVKRPTLRPGYRGPTVTELQKSLKQQGYYDGVPDGAYDQKTKTAVAQFQKAVGLTADGVAGSATWNSLQTAQPRKSAPLPSSPSPTQSIAATNCVQQPAQPLKWVLGSIAVSALGGGLFLWGRHSGKAAKRSDPSVAKNKGFSDHNPSSDRYPTTVLPAGDSLDANNANHSATDRLAVGETTRLSRINIVDELVNDLQSSDPTKRRKAIWELGQRGDSQAVQPLVNLMVDSDSQQRSLILTALSEIGTRTLKPMNRALAMSLQDQSPDVRKNAIRDLTRIYDLITQISQLLHYAVDDADTEVQETAQWALGQLNRIRSTSGLDNLPALHNSSNSPGSLSEEGAP